MKILKSQFFLGLGLLGFLLAGCSNESTSNNANAPKVTPTNTTATAPATTGEIEVAVVTTSEGVMVLEFYPDVAPKHVENFKTLAKKG